MATAARKQMIAEAHEAIRLSRALLDRADTVEPVTWAESALALELDTWQRQIMTSEHSRLVVVAARQSGKSVVTGAKAAFEAATTPRLRVVTVAPSQRQASLLGDKIENALSGAGAAYSRIKEKLHLENGATVSILHGDRPATLRGFSADLLLADELGFAKADLLPAIMPMLAATKGRLIAISSPNGPSGPLYELTRQEGVELLTVPARQVRHFDPATIEELRSRLGPALARQELDAEFVASSASVFSADVLDAMFAVRDVEDDSDMIAAEDAQRVERELDAIERRKNSVFRSDRFGLKESA